MGSLIVVILVVAFALWISNGLPGDTDGPATASEEALVAAVLALPTAEDRVGGYSRDEFGSGWQDPDRNGCDARNDVLARDLTDLTFRPGTHECIVLTGVLHDPYTGSVIDFVRGDDTSEMVQIDHIVPLSWAWAHGAHAWSDERRVLFANDPSNLLAVDGPTNSSKSDSGPAEWTPPAADHACAYATDFTQVLTEYRLGIDSADRRALVALAATCP